MMFLEICIKSDAKNNYNVGIGNNGSSTVINEVPTTNTTLTHGLKVKI